MLLTALKTKCTYLHGSIKLPEDKCNERQLEKR